LSRGVSSWHVGASVGAAALLAPGRDGRGARATRRSRAHALGSGLGEMAAERRLPGARGHAQCAEERWCGGSGVRCSGAVGRSVELQGRSVGRGRGAPAGWLGVLARGLGRRCSAWDEVGIEEREDAVADAGEHGLDLGAVGVDGEREEKGGERVGGGGLRGGGAAARGQRSAGGARRGVRAARLSGARTAAQGRRRPALVQGWRRLCRRLGEGRKKRLALYHIGITETLTLTGVGQSIK
jgi:hypothetical protein